jgi:hypothetical protein
MIFFNSYIDKAAYREAGLIELKNTVMERTVFRLTLLLISIVFTCSCSADRKRADLANRSADIEFLRGELAICGAPEFGKVNFGLTCTDEVQKDFNLAIALLHSFEYKEAEKAFVRVIDADAQCAIAYWGVAMSNLHELWAPPTRKELEKCSKILEIARSLPTKSAKEADYIDAISAYFKNWDKIDHQARADKYADRMRELYIKYPDDKEAAVFYALALNGTADPADKTYARQREAGELLNSLFPDQPDHPGIAHYLIHNYDYPELADLGLDAARRYAAIAPASAHAQHMPSHIFTRLGLWEESISSNLRSADAAICYLDNLDLHGHGSQELHALDYLMYAYLQQSDLDKAGELLAYVSSIGPEPAYTHFSSAYAFAAMPCRYALERKQWAEAAAVQLYPEELDWEKYPWEKCLVHFTRLLGMSRTGDMEGAAAELAQLKAYRDQLMESEEVYKSNQVAIQVTASEAWIAFAEGDMKKAVRLMKDAADAEDATGKHPVTPGEVLPAREQLADMLMELERYEEALSEYKASMKRAPNRYNSLTGAIRAARETGNGEEAAAFEEQLNKITIPSEDDAKLSSRQSAS